jgi:hypothetical protein
LVAIKNAQMDLETSIVKTAVLDEGEGGGEIAKEMHIIRYTVFIPSLQPSQLMPPKPSRYFLIAIRKRILVTIKNADGFGDIDCQDCCAR